MSCFQIGLEVVGRSGGGRETRTRMQISALSGGLGGLDLPTTAGPGVGAGLGMGGCWLLGMKLVLCASQAVLP